MTRKVAVRLIVEYNTPARRGAKPGDTMLDELILKADAEFERVKRLRGYL
jgi:hypothetical protein